MKQIILVKGVTVQEFDYISDTIKTSLERGDEQIPVFSSTLEAEIDIIEIPDTDEKPTIIHNSYMGMSQADFETSVIRVLQMLMSNKKDE